MTSVTALLSWILINKINHLHNYYTGDTTRSTLTLKMGDKAFSHVPAGWETAEEVGDVVGLTAGHECRSWGPIGPAEVKIKSLDSHQPLLSYTPAYTNDSECYVCYINYGIISGVGTYYTEVRVMAGAFMSREFFYFTFTFTFMHLADAFIQSDLQCIQAIHLYCQYVCKYFIYLFSHLTDAFIQSDLQMRTL